MRRNRFLYLLVMVAAACGVLASGAPCQAQDQSPTDSVAEAARKAREKKKASNKAPKVISDDDLDRRNFQPGQEGLNVGAPPKLETEPPSPEAVAAAEAADEAEKEAAKKAAEEDAELARLKERLADAEKDLDLAQREFALDQDAYLSKVDYAKDTEGKAKLDAEKQQISDKQQEIEKLKTKIAALEELKSHRKPRKGQAARPPQPPEEEKPVSPTPPQL
jgi:glucose/arabinose dehydrogenase